MFQLLNGSAHRVGASYSGFYKEGEVKLINCGICPNLSLLVANYVVLPHGLPLRLPEYRHIHGVGVTWHQPNMVHIEDSHPVQVGLDWF